MRAQAAVEKRALVVVHSLWLAGPAEDVAGELEHVVTATAFFRGRPQFARQLARIGTPAFVVAGAASAIGSLGSHLMPEIIGDLIVAVVARKLVATGGADDLGDVGVRVKALQSISVLGERIKESLVIETAREREVLFFARDGIKVKQHFIHAAVFDHLHARPLVVANRLQILVNPHGHAFGGRERPLIAAMEVHVQVSDHYLVVGVEGGPDFLAIAQAIVELGGVCTEITVCVRGLLTLGQLHHHGVRFGLEFLVSRAGIVQRTGREIMAPGKVPAQFALGLFPTAHGCSGRRNSSGDAEHMQEAVVRERVQIAAIDFHRFLKGPRAQANLGHGKRL